MNIQMIEPRHIKGVLFVLLIAALVSSQYLWDLTSYFRPEEIQKILRDSGAWAPVVYMSVMAVAVVISPIPSLPLDIAAGGFFGPLLGTVYSVLGAFCGALASFLAARFLGRELIERFL